MPETMPNTFDGLADARRLLRTIRMATMATLSPGSGFPLATLTTVATDFDGKPILLLSQLSTHTQNLDADGRCSLLLSLGGKGDPLAHPRLSLVGKATRVTEPVARASLRQRFLNRNPKAALYADFGDFSFWRVELMEAHLNGGFGKAAGYSGLDLLSRPIAGLPEAEAGLLERLNFDAAVLRLRVKADGGPESAWRVTGVDANGVDLAAGEAVWRLGFVAECTSMAAIDQELIALAHAPTP